MTERKQPPPPPPGRAHIPLAPLPGFDPLKVNWGAPDQTRTEVCSYCDGPLPEAPLIFWTGAGWCAEFCDKCASACFGFEFFPDAMPGDDDDEEEDDDHGPL